jgi:hypothetical protein
MLNRALVMDAPGSAAHMIVAFGAQPPRERPGTGSPGDPSFERMSLSARPRHARWSAVGLGVAALGIAVLWAGRGFGTHGPAIRIVVLAGAAGLVLRSTSRWVTWLGMLVAIWAAIGLVASGGGREFLGHAGAVVATGRWLQAAGLIAALGAGASTLAAMRTDRSRRPDAWGRGAQAIALLVLAPICAEYLAAYDDSTGDLVALAGGLAIFVPLYGAPALLIREAARRAGLGWVGIVWLAAAFGLLQAGVVDQSLFSVSYRGLTVWEGWRASTLVPGLGISAHMALAFVVGHVIYSIAAPIALVEALAPERRLRPWLGWASTIVTTVFYVAASALVLADHLAKESSHASGAQVAGSLVVCALFVVCGVRLGRRQHASTDRTLPRASVVFLAGLTAATVVGAASETWASTASALVVYVVVAAWVVRSSRGRGWSAQHAAALAAGALLSRAFLAFTYFPLIGDVSPTAKYAHNVALLGLVAGLSWIAARRSRAASPDGA